MSEGDRAITQNKPSSIPDRAPDDLVALVAASLDADKGEDVLVIDLRGRSSIADHMVIATGQSSRQLTAMAEHLAEKLKAGRLRVAIEGLPQADWVLIDAGDVIVHLFRPEVRSFYNLERMWGVPEQPAATV
jgi:ribosome-associated protein